MYLCKDSNAEEGDMGTTEVMLELRSDDLNSKAQFCHKLCNTVGKSLFKCFDFLKQKERSY